MDRKQTTNKRETTRMEKNLIRVIRGFAKFPEK